MCSACKVAQTLLAEKQDFEKLDKGCHGLLSVVVVDGWYDMGYEITCRQNLGIEKQVLLHFWPKITGVVVEIMKVFVSKKQERP